VLGLGEVMLVQHDWGGVLAFNGKSRLPGERPQQPRANRRRIPFPSSFGRSQAAGAPRYRWNILGPRLHEVVVQSNQPHTETVQSQDSGAATADFWRPPCCRSAEVRGACRSPPQRPSQGPAPALELGIPKTVEHQAPQHFTVMFDSRNHREVMRTEGCAAALDI
jgi:hypothetical protein